MANIPMLGDTLPGQKSFVPLFFSEHYRWQPSQFLWATAKDMDMALESPVMGPISKGVCGVP